LLTFITYYLFATSTRMLPRAVSAALCSGHTRALSSIRSFQSLAPLLRSPIVSAPFGCLPSLPHHRNMDRSKVTCNHQHQNQQLSIRLYSQPKNYNIDDDDDGQIPYHKDFLPGTNVQVEVKSFGPLGASVDVISLSHDADDLIGDDDPPLAQGLILQSEISYFRQWRHNIDVVKGEVLPAYVERVREIEEGGTPRLDISLRTYGGKAKAKEIGELILERIERGERIAVGDKSQPADINREFPGVSKGAFKKAVAALYKKKKVKPGPYSVQPYSE